MGRSVLARRARALPLPRLPRGSTQTSPARGGLRRYAHQRAVVARDTSAQRAPPTEKRLAAAVRATRPCGQQMAAGHRRRGPLLADSEETAWAEWYRYL